MINLPLNQLKLIAKSRNILIEFELCDMKLITSNDEIRVR